MMVLGDSVRPLRRSPETQVQFSDELRRALGVAGLIWLAAAASLFLLAVMASVLRYYNAVVFSLQLAGCGSGLVAIVMLCRDAVRIRAELLSAEPARRDLQSALDAMPSGVVLYD